MCKNLGKLDTLENCGRRKRDMKFREVVVKEF